MMRRRMLLVGVACVVGASLEMGPVMVAHASAARVPATSHVTATPAPWVLALWPVPPTSVGYANPAAAVRSFALSRLHMRDELIVTSRVTSSTGVETVRTSPTGVATNIHVRQFSPHTGWWVISSTTPRIDVRSPVAGAAVASGVRVRGTSLAFEGVVNVSLFVDGRSSPLSTAAAVGGGTRMAPFSATLHFSAPGSRYGTLVVYAKSAMDGSTVYATSRRVDLS